MCRYSSSKITFFQCKIEKTAFKPLEIPLFFALSSENENVPKKVKH